MNTIWPLMQREWLQHRFAWLMLMLVPIALSILPLAVGEVEFDADVANRPGPELALLLGFISMVASIAVLGLLLWIVSAWITVGSPRRDHGDRSIEFWMSLPTSHSVSLATPIVVHMVLVPAAALVVGLMGGWLLSLVLVGRFVGFGEWLALPWGSLLPACMALVLRIAAGLPLALLWLAPLLLLAMLSNAVFKRWGLPVLAVALGLGGVLLENIFGWPLLQQTLAPLVQSAGLSIAGASGESMTVDSKTAPDVALSALPGWAATDFAAALHLLVSVRFVLGLVVAAVLFYGLVLWRQRGAGAGG
jgi:ABC-2 type transport system permease protein